jgi:AraC family transcriptional regulator of adaptative response/methylated-DNA-[protein]-cysteine methyltransferase
MLAENSVDDQRWASVVGRDAAADGTFFYSVRTTGVYCRPSCGARTPNRRNVAFHATPQDAEAAGFRPCKRCEPHRPPRAEHYAKTVAAACRTIEGAESPPSLDRLSKDAGLSPHHFHRVFKAMTGVTPRAYAHAERARRVREGLADAGTVTQAIYSAGFNSGGRFYEQAPQLLGMTPTRFRNGGERTTIRFAVGETSLGAILVAATEVGVCAILLGDEPAALVKSLQDRFNQAELIGSDAAFEGLVAKVVGTPHKARLRRERPHARSIQS